VLPQQPTRNTLQAVDEFRDGHFRRVDHHQVNVVVLPAALLQFRPKVPADPLKMAVKSRMASLERTFLRYLVIKTK
jgi:hypothetical protein